MITAAVITSKFPLDSKFLDTLLFADEIIIVVDTDKPVSQFSKGNINYFNRNLNRDFASQRNFALQKAKGEWVLFVDDDELVSKGLAEEILTLIKNTKCSGFYLNRKDTVFHQQINYGETGDIKILRLARRNAGKFSRSVHEKWEIDGEIGEVQSPLYHIKDDFITGFLGRIARYGEIDSKELTEEGKPFSYWRMVLNPIGKFLVNYIFKRGLLDGYPGLFSAYLMSVQSLSVRIFQWEKIER